MAFKTKVIMALSVLALVKGQFETEIRMCAEQFRNNAFLLATVGDNLQKTSEWIPSTSAAVTVRILPGGTVLRIQGTLRERSSPASETVDIDLVFFNSHSRLECTCADDDWLQAVQAGTADKPKYMQVTEKCQRDNVENPVLNPDGLLWCPMCAGNLCGKAKRDGKPDPVWSDWQFYSTNVGVIDGPGFHIMRQAMLQKDPNIDPTLTQCTTTIQNQPSLQMHCDDYADVVGSSGNGVNGKNDKCGASAWLLCEEDIGRRSNENVPQFDINLNFVPCCSLIDFSIANGTDAPPFAAECADILTQMEANDCLTDKVFYSPALG